MFPKYNEDLFISFDWISRPSFANPNIISYYVYIRLVCLKAGGYNKCLYTGCFFLTCWLKLNHTFSNGQLLIIPSQSQVLESNSQYRADDNNHFTAKENEKARCIGLPTKAVAIYVGKKADHYYQNNYWSSKLLLFGLNQWIMKAY